jgi:hypothetical protein
MNNWLYFIAKIRHDDWARNDGLFYQW